MIANGCFSLIYNQQMNLLFIPPDYINTHLYHILSTLLLQNSILARLGVPRG
jgi:hypothetical protein